MPIMLDARNRTFVLFCVNNHRTGAGDSTMVAVEDWLTVPVTDVPGIPALARHGIVLRCYYCSVCGYVEMYMPLQAAPRGPGV